MQRIMKGNEDNLDTKDNEIAPQPSTKDNKIAPQPSTKNNEIAPQPSA